MLVRLVAEQARKRYSALHVAARVAQVGEIQQRVTAALQSVTAALDAVREQARAHPWLPPSWRLAIEAVHQGNVQQVATLQGRVQAVAEGLAALPVDAELAAAAPAPVPLPG